MSSEKYQAYLFRNKLWEYANGLTCSKRKTDRRVGNVLQCLGYVLSDCLEHELLSEAQIEDAIHEAVSEMKKEV